MGLLRGNNKGALFANMTPQRQAPSSEPKPGRTMLGFLDVSEETAQRLSTPEAKERMRAMQAALQRKEADQRDVEIARHHANEQDPARCQLRHVAQGALACDVLRTIGELTPITPNEHDEHSGDRGYGTCPICSSRMVVRVVVTDDDKLVVYARCWGEPQCDKFKLEGALIENAREFIEARIAREQAEQEERERVERLAVIADLHPKPIVKVDEQWLIANVLGRGIKHLIKGRAYGGKSMYGYGQAISIAVGVPWIGYAAFRERVLIIARDGTAGDDHRRRLRGLARAVGADLDQLEADAWIMYYDPRDELGRPLPVHLDNPEHVEQLMRYLDVLAQEKLTPGLMLLDNLTRMRGNRAINAANDPGVTDELWQPIEQIVARGITVSILHHTNKKGGTMGSEMNDAAADVSIKLERTSRKPNATIKVTGEARRPCLTEFTLRFVGGIGADGIADDSPIRTERVNASAQDDDDEIDEDTDDEQPNDDAGDSDAQLRAKLFSCLPTSSIYAAMAKLGIKRRNVVAALTKAMRAEGLIELVDGTWRAVKSRE